MEGTNVRLTFPEDIVGPDPKKPLPYDMEAECAVLGSLAISREALKDVAGLITPQHFTRPENALLYRIILDAYADGAEAMHYYMTEQYLLKYGENPDEVDQPYMWSILESEGTWRNAGYWARRLHNAHTRRQVVIAGLRFTRMAQEDDATPTWLVANAVELLNTATNCLLPVQSMAVPYDKLLASEVPPAQWIIRGLMPERGLTMIAGDPGVGKSWICYHIAQCVAAGKPFLGYFETRRTGVLVADCEGSESMVQRRLRKLHNGLFGGEEVEDLPLYLLPEGTRLDSKESEEVLAAEIERLKAGLVIIDPLVMAHGQDENSSTEMAKVFQTLKRIIERTKCAFLLVHHVRKQSMGSNQAAQRLRGSTAILGFLDSYLFLRQVRTGRIAVEHAKSRHAEPVPDFTIQITDPDDHTTVLSFSREDAPESPDKTQAALSFILRTLADNGGSMARKEIEVVAKLEGISSTTFERAVTAAVESRAITKERQGRCMVYRLAESELDLE